MVADAMLGHPDHEWIVWTDDDVWINTGSPTFSKNAVEHLWVDIAWWVATYPSSKQARLFSDFASLFSCLCVGCAVLKLLTLV